MFSAMVRHYGENAQVMQTFKTRKAANKYCAEQFEILKGYNKRFGIVDNVYVIFDNEGELFMTQFWVRKEK